MMFIIQELLEQRDMERFISVIRLLSVRPSWCREPLAGHKKWISTGSGAAGMNRTLSVILQTGYSPAAALYFSNT